MTDFVIPENLTFPETDRSTVASWMPFYIEPMIGSGERQAIGVVVASHEKSLVVPVSSLARLECVYGEQNKAILYAAQTALDSARNIFNEFGQDAFHSWVSPLEGIFTGEVRNAEGPSLEEIANRALMLCSSILPSSEAEEAEDQIETLNANRLESIIRTGVVQRRPGLDGAFTRTVRIKEDIRPAIIGFIGTNLAANFSLLAPSQLATKVKDAKSKLWDLASLRKHMNDSSFSIADGVKDYELYVHTISENDPIYSEKQLSDVYEASRELEYEADKQEIRCRSYTSTDKIVKKIISLEAA